MANPTIGYMTPAAAVELPKLLSGVSPYPMAWQWDTRKIIGIQPRAATPADGLAPKIEHWRGDVLLATYAHFGTDPAKGPKAWPTPSPAFPSSSPAYIAKAVSLGAGPFGDTTQVDFWKLWQEGDRFDVFPAVYTGPANNLLILPRSDGDGKGLHNPKNLTIRGITVNGIRPVICRDAGMTVDFASAQGMVYLWKSENITIENIDVAKNPQGVVDKAGVYLNNASNTILRQMRIHGFADHSAALFGENGIMSGGGNGGLLLDQVELFDNGGYDGPGHNAYIGAGADPNFTLHAVNCWFHGATVGHLFKTRAQRSTFEGCYFLGGVPRDWSNHVGGTVTQPADNWMLDCPNGGVLTVRNCVFLKQKSGSTSNGASITWGVEGIVDARELSVDIQHNTFVALTATYDGAHPVWPMLFRQFKWPVDGFLTYGDLANPVPVIVDHNAFVGYPTRGIVNAFMNYRGDHAVTAAFSELAHDFSLVVKAVPGDVGAGDTIIGTPVYAHAAQGGVVRKTASVGAID